MTCAAGGGRPSWLAARESLAFLLSVEDLGVNRGQQGSAGRRKAASAPSLQGAGLGGLVWVSAACFLPLSSLGPGY